MRVFFTPQWRPINSKYGSSSKWTIHWAQNHKQTLKGFPKIKVPSIHQWTSIEPVTRLLPTLQFIGFIIELLAFFSWIWWIFLLVLNFYCCKDQSMQSNEFRWKPAEEALLQSSSEIKSYLAWKQQCVTYAELYHLYAGCLLNPIYLRLIVLIFIILFY